MHLVVPHFQAMLFVVVGEVAEFKGVNYQLIFKHV